MVLKNHLISNILLVGGIALLVKIISFFKESIVASLFGLSELLDTYYIAVLIPTFVQNVFLGAFKNMFIPNYVIELSTTKQKGSFQSFTFLSITVLVVILALLAFIFVHFFLENVFPNHDEAFYQLIRNQFYIVIPCLFFWGYSGFLSGLLEIKNKFFASSMSQFLGPVTIILCLTLFRSVFGDLVLAWSLTISSFTGFTYLLIMSLVQKTLQFNSIKINKNIALMLKQYPPKVTSSLLTGINPFVDKFFAAQLVVGSISAIAYGTKIPAFTVAILILAIGNVLLPHFSKIINQDLEKAFNLLFKTLKIVFSFGVGAALITIIFSNDIIRILFERNEFSPENTLVVAKIQRIALVYVPFYLCTLICVKFLTAFNKNKFMAWTSLWNLILNLTLNFILVKYYAVYGLVLSTTIVYITASIIYVTYTYKLYRKHFV